MALGKTRRELLDSLDGQELAEWMVYSAIEPFGEERADLRAGIVASVCNNRWRGKGEKARGPEDFMPKFGRQEKPSRTEEQRTAAQIDTARLCAELIGYKDRT